MSNDPVFSYPVPPKEIRLADSNNVVGHVCVVDTDHNQLTPAKESTLLSIKAKTDQLTFTDGALQTSGGGSESGLTDTQLRATPVPVSGTVTANTGLSQPLTDTQLRATPVPVSGTFYQATQPISGTVTANAGTGTMAVSAASLPLPTGAATSAKQDTGNTSLSSIDGKLPALSDGRIPVVLPPGGSGLTDSELRASAVPVSLASVPSHAVTNAGTFAVQVTSAPTTAVTGTFWQATQPVSGTVTANAGTGTFAVSGTVTANAGTGTMAVSAASLPLPTGASTETTLSSINTKTPALGQAVMASSTPVVIASNQSTLNVAMADASVTFHGRASTFRTPGRAGTAGQKILSLHNATGSTVTVKVKKVVVDFACTVVKAITVLPPVIRLWKVTVLPTNGTALTKVKLAGTGASSASVTVLGDASADGTGSATTLTATLPAGTIITQEFAPRFVTAAGYEMADRMEFLGDTSVSLGALEGVVLFLDYTLATQNPTTDMWVAGIEWTET